MHVLLAIDLDRDPTSLGVVAYRTTLALGLPLHIVHIQRSADVGKTTEAHDSQLTHRGNGLANALSDNRVQAHCTPHLGDPVKLLSILADSVDCVVTVLGTSSGRLAQLGGTAGRLLHAVRRPLLFVPPLGRQPAEGKWCLLYGTDMSAASLAGMAWLRRLESAARAIHLVHVITRREADGGWQDQGQPTHGRNTPELDDA